MVVGRRINVAIVEDGEGIRVVAIRSNRPIATVVSDRVQRPVTEETITRGGVPSGRRTDA